MEPTPSPASIGRSLVRRATDLYWRARCLVMTGSFGPSPFCDLFRTPLHRRLLSRLVDLPASRVRAAFRELVRAEELRNHVDDVLPMAKGHLEALPLLYVLCRLLRPRVVVETGVASGLSSLFILQALDKNGCGRLHSIDLPDYDASWVDPLVARRGGVPGRPLVDNTLPEGKDTGWAVPSELRERWELILGDTRECLPPLLDRLKRVHLALHDSDHSREAILREGALLWEALDAGGLLLVDDVDITAGFDDLHSRLPWALRIEIGRLGILRKEETP